MNTLIILGDFLLGVGVLLAGLAALYYAYVNGSHEKWQGDITNITLREDLE